MVERRITDGKLKLLSKKFDPVTENVLEVCSEAVKKEIAHSVSDVSVRKVMIMSRRSEAIFVVHFCIGGNA